MSPLKSVSPACSIRLVMPEGPGDLSGSSFFISFLSSSGVNGTINKGCVVIVAADLFFVLLVWVEALRVEFLLKTDSGYPKDTGVTLFTLATPGNPLRYNTLLI